MSFTIKAEQLNQQFIQTVGRLTREKLAFKHSWRLKGLTAKLDSALDFVTESYTEIIKTNAKLDDAGNLVPKTLEDDLKGPDGEVRMTKGTVIPNSYVPLDADSDEKIKTATKELMDSDIEIDYGQMDIEAFNNIEISASELDIIEPILAIPAEVKDNVVAINR